MFRADTPDEARAFVAALVSQRFQNAPETPETNPPSEGAECGRRAFQADMRRQGRHCLACRTPLEEARVLRIGFQTLRNGPHAGSRGCFVSVRCECGRKIQVRWKVQVPERCQGER